MNKLCFRYIPNKEDISKIEIILKETTFFSENEIDIALSLIEEKIENKLQSSYQFIFLEKDNEVIGFSCYGFIEGTKYSYDLYWIAVDQQYKRNGYGSLLLKESEKLIAKNPKANIYIETSSTEKYKPTREFYKKHGYKKEAEIKDFYNENDNKCIYSKTITSTIKFL